MAKPFLHALLLFLLAPLALLAQNPDCIYVSAAAIQAFSEHPQLAKWRPQTGFPYVARQIVQPEGTWRVLVVLVDFPDYPWYRSDVQYFNYPESLFTRTYFENMLFSTHSFADPVSQSAYTGSMRDYFQQVSFGQFDISGEVIGWIRADHPMRYYVNPDGAANTYDDYGYGSFPQNVPGLVTEILQKIDAQVDFRDYDNTGDGKVDALFVVHAGPAAEEVYPVSVNDAADYIWSHAWKIPRLELDNTLLER
ncbi:MAG: immune inhibitor A, partial [candidate division KSB1 bacterium]|nr:immune inhibitor A [candidate division KSB1 bacterium]